MAVPEACAGCGRCCVRTGDHLDVYVSPGDDVPPAMVEVVNGLLWMKRTPDQTCVALDPATKLCRIYDVRPWSCRELQRGDPDCVSACGG